MSAHQRLAELTAVASLRALTAEESDALFHAHVVEDLRQRRLPARIMKLRAALHALEAELWPKYLPRLQEMEADAATALADRLEGEMGYSAGGAA